MKVSVFAELLYRAEEIKQSSKTTALLPVSPSTEPAPTLTTRLLHTYAGALDYIPETDFLDGESASCAS